MKSLTEHLWFETPHRRDYLNITDKVENLVSKSGVQEGLCLVNAMHITASVYINDAEDGLLHDYDAWLEKLAPHEPVLVKTRPRQLVMPEVFMTYARPSTEPTVIAGKRMS